MSVNSQFNAVRPKSGDTKLDAMPDWAPGEPHYPTPSARMADLIIHIIALSVALFGGGAAFGLALSHGSPGRVAAVAVYTVGMIAMLSFSTAYNFSHPKWQPVLYRVDHAGIFLMIAASYTPFTTQILHGTWSWTMTLIVWGLAILGVTLRLVLPRMGDLPVVGFYLALGWVVVIAIEPLARATVPAVLLLLAAGGIVYSIGAVLFMQKRVTYRRAIWHGHVIAGAAAHYAAIMVGVVLVAN